MTDELREPGVVGGESSSWRLPRAAVLGDDQPVSRGLVVMASVVRLGFLMVGVAAALEALSGVLADDSPPPARIVAISSARALVNLVWYGLVGWLLGRLLPAVAEFLTCQQRRAEAADRTSALVANELIPALNRLAEGIERAGLGRAFPARGGPDDAVAEIRTAIREARVGVAEELLGGFLEGQPGHPEGARLSAELDATRHRLAEELRAQMDAAREANDADGVLDLRGQLGKLLGPVPLVALDRDLAKWFMAVIHKRLRAGLVRPDLATLVAHVGEILGTTTEGASLRAALPTIRRSAGLCARCAEPYTGVADACPKCVARAAAVPATTAASDDDAEDETSEDMRTEEESPFL